MNSEKYYEIRKCLDSVDELLGKSKLYSQDIEAWLAIRDLRSAVEELNHQVYLLSQGCKD